MCDFAFELRKCPKKPDGARRSGYSFRTSTLIRHLWNSIMAIVSVTRLHLRSLRFFPGFLWYTRRSIRQAKRTPGNLGVRVRKTKGLAFWTLSMWRDNQAIRTFVPASPHREAMQKLPHSCDEAAFADWQQETTDWPSWETAAEKLAASGRLVTVLHPSEQHRAGGSETS